MGPDHIIANRSRNYERFRVVDYKRRELSSRALHHRFSPFTQVQDIHASIRGVLDWRHEPVTLCLDKFTLVKSGALFLPAGAMGYWFNYVD